MRTRYIWLVLDDPITLHQLSLNLHTKINCFHDTFFCSVAHSLFTILLSLVMEKQSTSSCKIHSQVPTHFWENSPVQYWTWTTFSQIRQKVDKQPEHQYAKSLKALQKSCENDCITEDNRKLAEQFLNDFRSPVSTQFNSIYKFMATTSNSIGPISSL